MTLNLRRVSIKICSSFKERFMYKFYEIHQYELDVVNHHRALKYGEHMHDELEIIYIFEGEQGLDIGGSKYKLKQGDCAVIFPNCLHAYSRPEGVPKKNHYADSLIIFAPSKLLYSIYPDTRGAQSSYSLLDAKRVSETAALAFRKILDERSLGAQIGWTHIILSHILPELNISKARSDEDPEIVSKVMTYVTLNFRNSLTLDSIADALGVNKYYVSRIFSNKIKVNFRTYLGSLRSNYAAQLINISDEKLSDIAEKAGFESMRSFYRVFRETFGITPAEYRKLTRRA